MPMPKKPRNSCLNCGKEPNRPNFIYCSNRCQINYQHTLYINKWRLGEVSGMQPSLGIVSAHVKNYLRGKYRNKCSICDWAEINPFTKQIPLVADHIDGNWKNNSEENLRLICPNCNSLSSTYAGLNRGNGRKDRQISNRIKKSKELFDKPV